MSSRLDVALDNFIYRMERIDPTDRGRIRRGFSYVDPEDIDEEALPGLARTFQVYWDTGSADFEPCDEMERWADFVFRLEVAYSAGFDGAIGTRDLQKILARDLHDIKKALRDTDNYNGTDKDPSADTGIKRRVCRGVRRVDTDSVMVLQTEWDVTIMEQE